MSCVSDISYSSMRAPHSLTHALTHCCTLTRAEKQGKDPMANPWSEARVEKKARVEKNLSNRLVIPYAGTYHRPSVRYLP